MTDPLRTDVARPSGGAPDRDKEARIEQLLLSGLDQYFSGNFEQAINIWTRVAFLERSHNRARAYIERARRALAERHRESDELLHRGIAAFNSGQPETARELITRAVEQGGPQDVALVLLERLNRLGGPAMASPAPSAATSQVQMTPDDRIAQSRPRRVKTATVLMLAAAAVAVVLFTGLGAASWLLESSGSPQARTIAPVPDPLPIPTSSERIIDRALALRADGRLLEAARTLEKIDVADPLRSRADRLRGELQTQLISAGSAEAAR